MRMGFAATLVLALFASVLSGCPSSQTPIPLAVKPVLKEVLTQRFPPVTGNPPVVGNPPAPVVVPPSSVAGGFVVQPAYRLYVRFTGPQVGTGIDIDFNGTALPHLTDSPAQAAASLMPGGPGKPGGTGWYDYHLNNSGSDVFWEAIIVLPGEARVFCQSFAHVNIRNTSANPNAQGTDKRSDPLTIVIVCNSAPWCCPTACTECCVDGNGHIVSCK